MGNLNFFLMFLAVFVSFGLTVTAPTFDDDINVLWLGNSYTYVNDVPKTTQGLTYHDGIAHHMEYDQHTEGGWTWEDHANSQETLNKIASQKWDIVVLQEQSQRPAFDEDRVCRNTVEPLNTLVQKIKESSPNADIQFYDTWGRPKGDETNCPDYPQFCTYESMQDALTTSYSTFACMNLPSRLAPVGEGFRKMEEVYGLDARLSLYNTNGESDHHASEKGSYLSACLHYLAMFGYANKSATVVGNDEHGGLNHEDALLIQELAVDVWNRGEGWKYPDDSDCTLHIC